MSTETRFSEGDRVEAVEHNDSTKEPIEGGRVHPGVVIKTSEAYASVRYDDPGIYGGKPDTYWQGSGWRAWDGWFRWRIQAAPETPASAGGE